MILLLRLRLPCLLFASLAACVSLRSADLPALFQERVKSVVAVEFFTETELDRRPTVTNAFVADINGTLVMAPGAIDGRVQTSQLKDFRVYLPGKPVTEFAHAVYLGQDPLSGWHFVRVEEKLRAQLTPVTAFASKSALSEPAIAEDYWGIGLRRKDEDFMPYFLTGKISTVQSLPERTAIALAEVAAPGLPVFTRDGALAGIAVGGFGSSYLQFSRNERGSPVMLMNVEESRVIQLVGDVLPWMRRVPSNLNGRPIAWLGAYGLQPMDPDVAAFLKLGNQSGCVVSEVLADSPAEAAGMEDRDIIVAIDGQPLPRFTPDQVTVAYLDREISKRRPGDKFSLTVLRGTDRIELVATLTDQPKLQREGERKYFDKLGLTVREFVYGDGVLRRVNPSEQRGVIANFVKNNSPVGTAGLSIDDWILEVDGTEIKTYAQAISKLGVIQADATRTDFVLLTSRNNATAVLRVKLK
jgi:serine protease Do